MAMDPSITTPTTATTAATATTTTTSTAPRPMSSPPHLRPNPQLSRPQSHDPSQPQPQPFLYPVSSSGRGFIPRGLRPPPSFASDPHAPPSLAYSHGVYLNHITTRQQHPHHHHHHHHQQLGPTSSPPFKALPFSPHPQPKAAPRSAVSDTNGYKDTNTRERSRDEQCYVVRGRKVRITEDASLYALCRSWLKNDAHEENQPQQKDVMKALPKPLPASMVAGYMSNKKEEKDDDEHEENEESVEHLSPSDLLKRHIKRAKKVRARLRDERLCRITRYRSRLRLLLPPPVEQFRNDTAAGN